MTVDERTYAGELAQRATDFHGAAQSPKELTTLIGILRERAGDVKHVLEIGVYKGGTSWLWKTLWPQAVIVGIDDMSLLQCDNCDERRAHKDCPFQLLERNTEHALIMKRRSDDVPKFQKHTFDLLHIDGDHSARGVRKDWNNYTPFVKQGGFIVLHDISTHDVPDWGVAKFWDDHLSRLPGAIAIREPNQYGIGVVPW